MKKIQIVTIVNKGQFNFDYNFNRKDWPDDTLKIKPDRGTVESGKSKEVSVILEPEDTFDINSNIELEIVSGPK